ncbi:hypothetical protein B0H10DRAFT_487098, partial [Mycena sp. CBHHK59/15]
ELADLADLAPALPARKHFADGPSDPFLCIPHTRTTDATYSRKPAVIGCDVSTGAIQHRSAIAASYRWTGSEEEGFQGVGRDREFRISRVIREFTIMPKDKGNPISWRQLWRALIVSLGFPSRPG